MSSNIVTANEHSEYKDEEVAVLKCSIAMGVQGFIVYSYSLTAVQLLETLTETTEYFSVAEGSYKGEFIDGRVILNGIDSQWNYELIENENTNWGAVVFYLVPIRGDETDYEWQIVSQHMSAFLVYLKNRLVIKDAAIEGIQVPKHNQAFDDNGFSFVHAETADAFRGAVKLKMPYKTTLTGKTTAPPIWYKTGNPSTAWGSNNTSNASSSNTSSTQSGSNGGCYVATAVYGSYDCPQVWTLRRYRDYAIAKHWYGRAFIRMYYAISPTLVKRFGHTSWFSELFKGKLNRMVKSLQEKGYESTPYKDRPW